MNIRPELTAIGNRIWNFKTPLFRGGIMLVIGVILLSTTVLSPNIGMMGVLNYSWLLFCGYFSSCATCLMLETFGQIATVKFFNLPLLNTRGFQ